MNFINAIDKSELENDLALGLPEEQVCLKFGIDAVQYGLCLEAYLAKKPLPDIQVAETKANAPAMEVVPEIVAIPRSEFHYTAQPRGDNVFILPTSKEHSSKVIIPDAHKEKSDIGYVWAVGPEVSDLKKGDVVLFDKFSTVGQSYSLLDDDGDEKEFLMLRSVSVVAVLHREKRKEYRGTRGS